MSFTTFIIPTIGRASLQRTIDSLLAQQDSDFECIIIFDGIDQSLSSPDSRFRIVRTPTKLGINRGESPGESLSAMVRNYGIELVQTDWISFIDDDDTITPDYVRFLKEVQDNDVVIFRMKYFGGLVLPPLDSNEIVNGGVGISFSVRKAILDKYNTRFINSGVEDYELLASLQRDGARMHVSPYITYHVRH